MELGNEAMRARYAVLHLPLTCPWRLSYLWLTYIIIVQQTVNLETIEPDGALERQEADALSYVLIAPDADSHLVQSVALLIFLSKSETPVINNVAVFVRTQD